VFNNSSGMSNSTQVKGRQFIVPRNYAAGFTMALMAKDLRTAADLAEQLGADVPTMTEMADIWARAAQKVGLSADHTAIHKFLEGK
jgi:3-hydroxyisobutyrate dehydrogenase